MTTDTEQITTARGPAGFGLSDLGRVRQTNQDTILVMDAHGLYGVADGIGGYLHGDAASALVAEVLAEAAPNLERDPGKGLEAAIRQGNARIRHRARELGAEAGDPEAGPRMGSTVVALCVAGGTATIAHVGDSRAYRFRNGLLEALTLDHSMGAQAAAHGGQVGGRFRNLLTRAVGIAPEVEVEVRQERVQPGDRFLLCSDGLTGPVSDARIAAILAATPSLEAACRALIEEANVGGGKDNISVVLVRC